ncbi:hypothetical protein HHI36_019347 [Cryptolaemus montrouzieri]|uniref:RRM domain-containing protein n=1 Tax=Cryptolaemus montrouzieri TaxID=559131 RepID=A0ABD2P2S3_9CUCU
MSNNKILDFKVVHFRYMEDDSPHEIFVKEHSSRSYDEDKPLGRTLFVVNIPPYVDEQNLKRLFSEVGDINSVKLHRGIPGSDTEGDKVCNSNGFQTGYIVYNKRESLVKSLNLSSLKPVVDEDNKLLCGLAKYAKEYNNSIYDHNVLFEEATKAIKLYDKQVEERKNKDNEQVDEEGWTIVTKKGRNPGLALKESVENKLNEKHKNKMKKKMLQNFYSFQIRESKKKHLATLREQHEEAKRKIEEMKKNRTFRPY